MIGNKRPKSAKTTLAARITKVAAGEGSSSPSPGRLRKVHYARASRAAAFKDAELELGDGARVPVVIKNLSAAGARVDFVTNAVLTDRVVLCAPQAGLRQPARVAWRDERSAGLAFDIS